MADYAKPGSSLGQNDGCRSLMMESVLAARSAPAFEVGTVGA
jgi:hypothetical protein